MRGFLAFLWLVFFSANVSCYWGQNGVGLVLSGGGATGMAHIGVLKALEEHQIPINFICGTSAGALVGAMYASGLSPKEIEQLVISEKFKRMSMGEIPTGRRYLYREKNPDAGMLSIPFNLDSMFSKSIPLNLVQPTALDFEMLNLLGQSSTILNKDFNALLVPFRCVASDIKTKKAIAFGTGDLNAAVRASMTYPLYLNPIKIENVIYFDGGLYNNFPVDVMYHSFHPDYIIGSNVSANTVVKDENDFIGLLDQLTRVPTNYNLPCENGIIINPNPDVTTFDFSNVEKAIASGYESTLRVMDTIKLFVKQRADTLMLADKRRALKSRLGQIPISEITTSLDPLPISNYIKKSLLGYKKGKVLPWNSFENRYYKLYAAEQIEFMFPTLTMKPDSTLRLDLMVRKSKPFKVSVGGHLSSRSVNTGFLGLTYRRLGKLATTLHAETYFGKFYGSAKAEANLDFPGVFPVATSAYFTMNRWDYYRSFATFFEDVKPSFLVQNEMYFGLKFKHPLLTNSRAELDLRGFSLQDDYYQTMNFLSTDTTDFTFLKGSLISYEITDNALNRKQFANEGHFLTFKVKFLTAMEKTTPGTTAQFDSIVRKQHDWLNLNLEAQYFLWNRPHLHFGIHGKAMFNSQSLFANYTASLLSMPTLNIIPDLETYFLKEYRSPQFVCVGTNLVIPLIKSLEWRLDAYYYQPFVILEKFPDGTITYAKPFQANSFLASSSVLYHTPFGPLRATLNYFPLASIPWNFQLSFGYVLFNERAVR